ncbi:MAG: tyrosine-type recombinase/integrase [Anaerolineales bacterium]
MMRGSIICRKCNLAIHRCPCRGDRTFAVRIYAGTDPQTGKERQKWVGGFRSLKEAEAHLLEVARSPLYGSGLGPHGSVRQRVGDYLEEWLAGCRVGEKELTSRKTRVRLHVKPHIGHVVLSRVAPATIERLFTVELAAMNPTSANKVWRDLRQAFGKAVRLGYITSNPVEVVEPPKPREFRPTILTPEELARFLAECDRSGDRGLLFKTAFVTGARRGELLAAQWRHTDLEKGVLLVVQDLDRPKGGGFVLGDVKSSHSRRPIRLPASLTAELQAMRKRQVAERLRLGLCQEADCRTQHCPRWHDGDFVFCQPNGKPLHGHNLTVRDLKALCRRAVVPSLRMHDLRHLHATVLMREGVSAKIVAERMGHHAASFTLDAYSWATPDMQRVAVEALERTLPRRGAK